MCRRQEREFWHRLVWVTMIPVPRGTPRNMRTQLVCAREKLCSDQWEQTRWIPAYPRPCGQSWDNSADQSWSAAQMLAEAHEMPECHCQRMAEVAPECIDHDTGHIRTSNIDSILRSPQSLGLATRYDRALKRLKTYIHKGQNYRPPFNSDAEVWQIVQGSLSTVITDALDMISSDTLIIPEVLKESTLHTAQAVGWELLRIPWHETHAMGRMLWQTHPKAQSRQLNQLEHGVRALQRHLVITRVDLSEPNFSFVCKHLYRSTILGRLREDGDFETINIPEARGGALDYDSGTLAESARERMLQILDIPVDTGTYADFPTCEVSSHHSPSPYSELDNIWVTCK